MNVLEKRNAACDNIPVIHRELANTYSQVGHINEAYPSSFSTSIKTFTTLSKSRANSMTTYVNLGKSGLKVSRLALGTMTYGSRKLREWVLEEEESRPFIQLALELGINFFDTADVYSLGASEEILGRALKDFAKRDQVVIATKVFSKIGDGPNDRGLSRKHIFDGIDASLRRLQTDYVDLYQIHRWDYETPIEETLEALHDVVKSGKVRYLGISSVYAWQFAKALYTAGLALYLMNYPAHLRRWTRFLTLHLRQLLKPTAMSRSRAIRSTFIEVSS